MKKLSLALACVLTAASVSALCACGDKNKVKRYTVTFDTKGGSAVASYKLDAGAKIKRPKDPTKEMFKFDDWYWQNPNDPTEVQKFEFNTAISQNITIFAGWVGETSARVEFDANGGYFAEGEETVFYGLYGSRFDDPELVPERDGYEFDGWYTDPDGFTEFTFDVFPSENATLYAGWAESGDNAYISYYGNGELLRVEYMPKGETVVFPTDLFDDDIVVGDWYTDKELTKKYTAGKTSENLDLYTSYYTDGLRINNGVVTGYDGDSANVIVPTVYNGNTVTSVGEYAFYRSTELPGITSVKLPETVSRIGIGAFYECQRLADINLSQNVSSIGDNAFYKNIRLKSVGDISGVEIIGSGAFNGCYVLQNMTLLDGLKAVNDYAFNDCKAFTEVTLPSTVKTVGEYSFSGCTSLTTVTFAANDMRTVGKFAFAGCEKLKSVTVNNADSRVVFDNRGNPFDKCRNVVIYVPSAQLDAYKNDANNTLFKDKFAAIG